MILKIPAAGFSETSALVSPPSVTANTVRPVTSQPHHFIRLMDNDQASSVMTQFQGISDSTCVTHGAVWQACYCAGIVYLGGRPHSCWQMYAVRSTATRPHLSGLANGSAGTHIPLWTTKFQIRVLRDHLTGSRPDYVCNVGPNRPCYYSVNRSPSHWGPYGRKGEKELCDG